MCDLYEIEDNNLNYYRYQRGSNIIIVYCKHIMHARTQACTRVRSHARARARAHIHRRRRRTGYRYSLAPNRDGPLRGQQCWSLAIQINASAGCPFSPSFVGVLTYTKVIGRTETRSRDRIYCQSIQRV